MRIFAVLVLAFLVLWGTASNIQLGHKVTALEIENDALRRKVVSMNNELMGCDSRFRVEPVSRPAFYMAAK